MFALLSSVFIKKPFWTQVCQNNNKFVNKIRTQFDRCVISDVMLKAMLKSLPFLTPHTTEKKLEGNTVIMTFLSSLAFCLVLF